MPDCAKAIDLFYIKGRLGWKGLRASEFREEGPYLVTGTDFSDGRVDWTKSVRITEERFEESPEVALRSGDILITKDGTIGKVAYVDSVPDPGRASLNSHIFLVRNRSQAVRNRFAFYVFQSSIFQHYVDLKQTGTTRVGLPQRIFEQFEMPLLPPQEQGTVGNILSAIDEITELTTASIKKMQQVKAGMMHDLFTRGVTPDGRLRPSCDEAPHLYKESQLGSFPKNWGVAPLTEYLDPVVGVKPGPFGSSLTKDIYTENGYRVYGQEQVIAGSLEVGEYFISSTKFAEMQDFEVKAGDVLLSLVGTVGCVLVVRPPFHPGIINPRLVRLRPARERARSEFTRFLLLTSIVTRQMQMLAGGGTMPVINGRVVKRLLVPIIDTEEQARIEARLGAIESAVLELERERHSLLMLKAGLMDDLLSGRMRVKAALE